MAHQRWLTIRNMITHVVGVTLIVLGGAWQVNAQDTDFAYSGDRGPGFWGDLNPDWEACANNMRQSPIDITGAFPDEILGPLDLSIEPSPLHLINNGHTIEQEYEEGSTLTFKEITYQLLQFHFHTLSEHTHDGLREPMELHAVFRNAETGNLAVIGLFFRVGEADTANPFLAQFMDFLPDMKGASVVGADIELNLTEALTNTATYWTYDGSLTTPPCSPIVTWIVLQDVAEMSREQFDAFRRILGNNFRPLQPLNDRIISATP